MIHQRRSLRQQASWINAELFELSPDGTKWLMVDSRMMYISVYRNEADRVRIAAVSQTGRTVLDTVLGKGALFANETVVALLHKIENS
ncbi:unnamed protein product [Nippostrongylus brasiliensis]|uniref:Transposase n=1 Tax=Nippostrongylus brasiliensis TaxID=27835 RepID=A0A0N4YWD1_NIPBR|nr:unnamed protein product [Nippostrongylus brasiliensis]